jgi:hypothetical protein
LDEPSLSAAIAAAPPGAHILLSAGMHRMKEQLSVTKRVQIIGEMNAEGDPMSFIRSNNVIACCRIS